MEEVGVGLGVSGLTARVCICRRVASYGFFCLSLSVVYLAASFWFTVLPSLL